MEKTWLSRKTEKHLMTGKRQRRWKTPKNAGKYRKTPKSNAGKCLQICIYKTEDIFLGVSWNLPTFKIFTIYINLIDLMPTSLT